MATNRNAADLPREKWDTWDPMLISEGLFSAANIFSSLKLVYIFSVNPYLGPLQVSLSRMIMDIMKFFFLYVLVLFAFSSGLNQLLWYYLHCFVVKELLYSRIINLGIMRTWKRSAAQRFHWICLWMVLQTPMRVLFGGGLQSEFSLRQISWSWYISVSRLFQSFRNHTNIILGRFRPHRFGQFRVGWYKSFYTILGDANVWNVFCYKHCCIAEFAYCYDESFLSVDLGKIYSSLRVTIVLAEVFLGIFTGTSRYRVEIRSIEALD